MSAISTHVVLLPDLDGGGVVVGLVGRAQEVHPHVPRGRPKQFLNQNTEIKQLTHRKQFLLAKTLSFGQNTLFWPNRLFWPIICYIFCSII